MCTNSEGSFEVSEWLYILGQPHENYPRLGRDKIGLSVGEEVIFVKNKIPNQPCLRRASDTTRLDTYTHAPGGNI